MLNTSKLGRNEEAKQKSEAFRERFQIVMYINDIIICQRYFRIPMYNSDALVSKELYDVLDGIVQSIKDDLKHKSFVFQSIMNKKPMKLCGFVNGEVNLDDLYLLTHDGIRGEVELSDGTTVYKEYLDQSFEGEDIFEESQKPEPYEYTYKFAFIADEKTVYEQIWDASQYPKFVRNSVDLSNSYPKYNTETLLVTPDNLSMYLKIGRKDLLYSAISKIIEVASGKFDDTSAFTKKMRYGDKEYFYSTYDKNYVDSYRKWTADKTFKYRREMYY